MRLPRQRGEVDRVGRMEHAAGAHAGRRAPARERPASAARRCRRGPAPARAGACARFRAGPGRRRSSTTQQAAVVAVRHRAQRDAVLHRQADGVAHPQQVVAPVDAADLVQRLPAGAAVLRLVPGAEGQRGHAEFRAGHVLGAAQRQHARIGAPRAFVAARGAVDHADVGHAFAAQREGGGLAAHAGAGDQHVEHRRVAVGGFGGQHPGGRRQVDALEIGARLRRQACRAPPRRAGSR